ncbi:MAG: TniQ family protein [Ferrovibrio sp.]|uniref:TniQ family protein n=1 Tax=Ferrovibrio sp. TaxID=1917215 RepID=UPI00262E4D14|nr:TniQ family protein [Ferrovibrio sp.]MCW0234747.1 TniQ family protein [Ferrovibrio sp.]
MGRAMTDNTELARLPFPATPVAGESLLGFLLRLAERNKVNDPIAFLAYCSGQHTTVSALALSASDMSRLNTRCGIPAGSLEAMAYRPIENGLIDFFGTSLRCEDLALQNRRFCPACLKEGAHHRAVWDLTITTVCIRHGLYLQDACRYCARPADWTFGSVGFCPCGKSYSTSASIPVPDQELRALKYVLGRIEGTVRNSSSKVLDKLAPVHAIELMLGLGTVAAGRTQRRRRIASLRDGEIGQTLNGGFNICLGWPDRLFECLGRLQDGRHQNGRRYGLELTFGPVAFWMKHADTSDEVRAVLTDAMSRHPDLKYAASLRSARVVSNDDGSLLTLDEAQQALRRAHGKVRDVLMRHGHVIRDDQKGGGAPILVNARAVWRLQMDLFDFADEKTLRTMLKCSRVGLKVFLKAGWLEPASGAAAELAGRPVWSKKAVCATLAQMKAETVGNRRPRKAVPMSKALSDSRFAVVDWSPFAMKREFQHCSWDGAGEGLAALLLDERVFRRARAAGPSTIPEAAVKLGVKEQVGYHLVNREILGCGRVPGQNGRRVGDADIVAFHAAYVIPRQLGLDEGRYRGWTSEQLVAEGLVPVSGPGVDGGRQFVFRRQDVERSSLFSANFGGAGEQGTVGSRRIPSRLA